MKLLPLMILAVLSAHPEPTDVKTNVPPPAPAATIKASADTTTSGKSLAKALERLQRVPSAHSQRDRYRVVTLLGGKLSARVPIR
jgi:hypothetical protein